MAKQRKTLRQKQALDLRIKKSSSDKENTLPDQKNIQRTYTFNAASIKSSTSSDNQNKNISSEYPFVARDLIKTAVVTSIIIIFEVALFLVKK